MLVRNLCTYYFTYDKPLFKGKPTGPVPTGSEILIKPPYPSGILMDKQFRKLSVSLFIVSHEEITLPEALHTTKFTTPELVIMISVV